MDIDRIGLGRWQNLVLQGAQSSGIYYLSDLLADYPTWADRSATYWHGLAPAHKDFLSQARCGAVRRTWRGLCQLHVDAELRLR